MKKLLVLPILLLSLASIAFGQYGKGVESRLIDEFGRLGHCDLTARLDNLYIHLWQAEKSDVTKGSLGVIIFYRRITELPGAAEKKPEIVRAMNNHIRFRNLDPGKVTFIDGGYRNDETYEIWLVPPGANPAQPRNFLSKPKVPSKKTFLWNRSRIDYEFGLLEKQKIIIDRYASGAFDDPESYNGPLPNPEYVAPDGHSARDRWVNHSFGKYLKRNSGYSGVIIYYLDDNWFDLEKVKAEIELGKNLIVEKAGIKENRIKILFGGYRDAVQAEFWLMKNGTKYPEATPDERPAEGEELVYGYGEIG